MASCPQREALITGVALGVLAALERCGQRTASSLPACLPPLAAALEIPDKNLMLLDCKVSSGKE